MHVQFKMTLCQCKVVVSHSALSCIDDEVHCVTMVELENHYVGDELDYLDEALCEYANFCE